MRRTLRSFTRARCSTWPSSPRTRCPRMSRWCRTRPRARSRPPAARSRCQSRHAPRLTGGARIACLLARAEPPPLLPSGLTERGARGAVVGGGHLACGAAGRQHLQLWRAPAAPDRVPRATLPRSAPLCLLLLYRACRATWRPPCQSPQAHPLVNGCLGVLGNLAVTRIYGKPVKAPKMMGQSPAAADQSAGRVAVRVAGRDAGRVQPRRPARVRRHLHAPRGRAQRAAGAGHARARAAREDHHPVPHGAHLQARRPLPSACVSTLL